MVKTFQSFLRENTRHESTTADSIRNDPRYKKLTAFDREPIDRYLKSAEKTDDPEFKADDLKSALAMLNRVAPAGRDIDRDYKFDALWEKRPRFTDYLSNTKYGNTEKRMKAFNTAYAMWLRKHLGGPSVWTDQLLTAFLSVSGKEPPVLTYKGTRYIIDNGMDEKEFVSAVCEINRVFL